MRKITKGSSLSGMRMVQQRYGCAVLSFSELYSKEKEENRVKRGDVYYADLNPIYGSEQGGIRPVLIIQNNMGNAYSPTVIIAPISSVNKKRFLPVHVGVNDNGILPKSSVILTEQIRTIDRSRLMEFIGTLSEDFMKEVDQALRISIGVE